ncbi:MAG: nicotinate-nucleotide adenylyltransferase [Saprospiraceae bacterium]|nr:nicotinate-nucleotide adenylyltransferase [Saprospiraceae bacterium]
MKIGLFFGSFNPVHNGHMIIANLVRELTDLDQVWMIVSPHNPHKKKSTLANDFDRLHLVNLAIADNVHLKASSIEFNLPQPSYTIDTLTYLTEKHPNHQFALIMGGDNLVSLPKWKNPEAIYKHYPIYVYNRPAANLSEALDHAHIKILDELPLLHLSSTYVRDCIRKKISIQYLVPEAVFEYLEGSTLYS